MLKAKRSRYCVCIWALGKKVQVLLNERRLFSDCTMLGSFQDKEGAYACFGVLYALQMIENESAVQAKLDTDNDFIRNKIDLRKARMDLYEELLTR